MEKHDVIKLLQSHQISPTRQRVDIGHLLLARPQHLCAEQVIDMLNASGNLKASKATVYNTLKLFSQHGLLRELHVDSGKVYFDSNTSRHQHIFNEDTGELHDVETGESSEPQLHSLPAGMTLRSVDVIYRVTSEKDRR